jgi:hypothetical protein
MYHVETRVAVIEDELKDRKWLCEKV